MRFGSVSYNSLGHVRILFKDTWITVRLFITDVCVTRKESPDDRNMKTVERKQTLLGIVRYRTAWCGVTVENLAVLSQ